MDIGDLNIAPVQLRTIKKLSYQVAEKMRAFSILVVSKNISATFWKVVHKLSISGNTNIGYELTRHGHHFDTGAILKSML